MNAKLKAEELIEKFAPIMPNENWQDRAKECALIAVDEILDVLHKGAYEDEDSNMNYWIEVRDEIEKL